MARKITVLVIDDEPIIRDLFVRLVQQEFCEVHAAGSGPAALELARKISFQLAFIDIRLPGMDGLAAFRELKKLQPKLQAVFISGYGDQDRVDAAIQEGRGTFLMKPFDVNHAKQLVRESIRSVGQKMIRVLVVDNNLDMREHIEKIVACEFQSASVEIVPDEVKALSRLGQEHFDLAFFEVGLQEIDEHELRQKIVEISPETKVILYVGTFGSRQDSSGQESHSVIRPFHLEEINRLIAEVRLQKRSA